MKKNKCPVCGSMKTTKSDVATLHCKKCGYLNKRKDLNNSATIQHYKKEV